MSAVLSAVTDTGALLPVTVMHWAPVRILAAFVTINTVMFCALAVAKVLPRMHPPAWLQGSNRRAEERSIHPSGRAEHHDPRTATAAGHAPADGLTGADVGARA